MRLETIDGLLWSKLVVASSRYLDNRKSNVDALNVFPVPDGDTGTNMSLTMASAARSIQQKNEPAIGEAAKTVSYGALMGARGNSGVILSQLLAGFAKRAEDHESLNAKGLAEALASAVQTAYQAVMNPVEGTILTVSKEASRSALERAEEPGATIEQVLTAALEGASAALEKTPSMLPVLQQAGVVDAGGQGFVYILEGMLKLLSGEAEDLPVRAEPPAEKEKPKVEFAGLPEGVLQYQYCTEFILKKKTEDIPLDTIRSFLSDKGDCMLVVGTADTAKIHIHTNHPGNVLEYCSALGSLHEIQIHNMSEQSQEMQMKARAVKHLGIIGVAMGQGMVDIFKSLGVDIVISGGQTMNPSTQDFLDAIDSILAEEVIILPNNSNVFLAGEQAAKVSGKPVQVVPTRSIPQGVAALMAFNGENDLSENARKMEEAAKQIITIEVTYAVRDAQYEGHEISKGQILGLVNDKLDMVGNKPNQVVRELMAGYLEPAHELMTIYYGEEISEAEARQLVEDLAVTYPSIDFELHQGGQPLYYYLISLE